MISTYAERITRKLCKENLISATDQDLYAYGFFLLISKILFFVISILWGLIWNVLWESIVFYIAFSVLRQYAGGYHASKEGICMTATTILLFTCILAIRIAENFSSTTIGILVLFISCLLIGFLSPIDTISKPLNKSEKQHYKCISCYLMLLFIATASIAVILQWHCLVHVLSICTLAESILLIIGHIKYVT